MRKYNIFGVDYAATNYDEAATLIVDKAQNYISFGVSALAVHGLITAYSDPSLKYLVNSIDLVVPDGQPIRWALNSFYNLNMVERVYGPTLTLHVLEKANILKLKLFLYGGTESTLTKLSRNCIKSNYPDVNICGMHIDRFREATEEEDKSDIDKINKSGANIVLVGRGCPRQELWVANHLGKVNAAMLAVGAAFDFHAGTVKQSPKWMQDRGLEWLYRLIREPRRLWKRYFSTNSYFIYLFILHKYILRRAY